MSEPTDPTTPQTGNDQTGNDQPGNTGPGTTQAGQQPGAHTTPSGPEFRMPGEGAQQAAPADPYAQTPHVAGEQPAAGAWPPANDPYATGAGQPMPEGATAPAPPAPAPKKRHRLVNAIVTVVVIAGIAVAGRACAHSDLDNMAVGNCVKVTQKSNSDKDISADKADCSSNPSYKVVKKATNKDACGENEDAYIEETKSGETTDVRCLMPNMEQGKCYNAETPTSWPSPVGARLVDCAASDAEFRVSKLIDNSSDTSKCSATEKPWSYNEDAAKRVYCLVATH